MKNPSLKKLSLLIAISISVFLGICYVWKQNKTVTIAEDVPEIQISVKYQSSEDITIDDLYHYIGVLASDSLEGRAAGTAGEKKSIDFICENFSDYGLNCHIQSFRFLQRNFTWFGSLSFGHFHGTLNRDFRPILPIDSCNVTGEVIFTGDGYRYNNNGKVLNDYQDIDVRGKWVMFFEEVVSVGWRMIGERYNMAQKNGAAGVLTIRQDSASNGQLVPGGFGYSTGMYAFQIPMIRISEKTADSLFRYVGYKTSEVLKEMKNKQLSFQIPVKVNGSVHTRRDSLASNNIIACFEGNDSILKKEYIIVGAHYDHIGTQTYPTVTGDSALIYYGADDNASGTAGVMELAEKLISAGGLKRSLIFILFGAEEQGLQGANYFCKHFPVPPNQIKLMINMDLIGRLHTINFESEKRIFNREKRTPFYLFFRLHQYPPQ